MGGGGPRHQPAWPPPATVRRWHLRAHGGLAEDAPPVSEPDQYRYDPAEPTPAVGGTSTGPSSGPKDNRELEARPDVLTYSTGPLAAEVEITGPVRAELYVTSTLAHTDFFARLCDVDPKGRSVNVTDGIRRLSPDTVPAPDVEAGADGVLAVQVELAPTAYRVAAGHRIRLQVSAGAFPRYARNFGTGEPFGTATRAVRCRTDVYHDAARPACLVLPVRPGAG